MTARSSDRWFWLATLGLALSPCIAMVVVPQISPPPALAAAPPEVPPRAPPPQLILPTAVHGVNAGASYDLLGFDNEFGDRGVPVALLPMDPAADAARDPAWEPTFRPPSKYPYWEGQEMLFEHRPPDDAYYGIVELLDCRGTTAVFRHVETIVGENAPEREVQDRVKCTRVGDSIKLERPRGCYRGSWIVRPGELFDIEGSGTRLYILGGYLAPLSWADIDRLREMARASMTRPPWPPGSFSW